MLKPITEFEAKRLACSAMLGVALMAGTAVSALAAPAPPTPTPVVLSTLPACVSIPGGTTIVTLVADATGQLSLPCTPQPGQQLVILGGGNTTVSRLTNPSTADQQGTKPQVTSTPTAIQQGDDHLGTMLDSRVDTYAKRQAIRDKYRGQINETTFNDELGDGVGLEQALADAMAELGTAH
ncbi:MAG: hypothetical protein JO020_00375 [Chloroflexi bacterium]|nr:hypothetical protein [Chloroflexota bacterium]MBV9131845.1 hypothetical protein [Chloroflexota bacterium]MBV9892606.1 hypothetical protein [Chloroflexota bacterium]